MMLHQGFRPLSTPVQLVPISPISLEMSLYLIEYEVKDAKPEFKRDANSRNPRHFDKIEGGRVSQALHTVYNRLKKCLRRST